MSIHQLSVCSHKQQSVGWRPTPLPLRPAFLHCQPDAPSSVGAHMATGLASWTPAALNSVRPFERGDGSVKSVSVFTQFGKNGLNIHKADIVPCRSCLALLVNQHRSRFPLGGVRTAAMSTREPICAG